MCYRRDDSAAHAGRLRDKLSDLFGPDNVFVDVDSVAPGDRFGENIQANIRQSGVMIVVIGRHWLTAQDSNGTARLFSSNDYAFGTRLRWLFRKRFALFQC